MQLVLKREKGSKKDDRGGDFVADACATVAIASGSAPEDKTAVSGHQRDKIELSHGADIPDNTASSFRRKALGNLCSRKADLELRVSFEWKLFAGLLICRR
jgi:hypothetical protein